MKYSIRIFIIIISSISYVTSAWSQTVRASCNPPVSSFSQIDSCKRIVFENTAYFTTTSLVRIYPSSKGCDSTVTYRLNIRSGDSLVLRMDSCDRATWKGISYFRDTTLFRRWNSNLTCDTLVRMKIQIRKQVQSQKRLDSCNRYTYLGKAFFQDTLIKERYIGSNGCDSIVNIAVQIRQSTSVDLSYDTCDRLRWRDSIYRKSTQFTFRLPNSVGCDSFQNVQIKIRMSSSNSQTIHGCQEAFYKDSRFIRDTLFNETILNSAQCDSLLQTRIRIGQPKTKTLILDSCHQALYEGFAFQRDTSFLRYFTSELGCDSTLNIQVHIRQSSASEKTLSSCEFVTYGNKRYFRDTIIQERLLNAERCDSNIRVLIRPILISRDTLRKTFCENDSFYFGGIYLKYPGTFNRSIPQDNGCLNYETLILKLNPSHQSQYRDSILQSRMPYQRWGFYVPYATIGDTSILRSYLNRFGCDSSFSLRLFVISDTLRLNYPILFSKYQKLLICRIPDSLRSRIERIQWYKNGEPILGEQALFLYESEGLNGLYRAILQQNDGVIRSSESLAFVKENPIKLSRNPVKADQYVTIHRSFTPEEWRNILVEVHQQNGLKVLSYRPSMAPIELPPMDYPGLYIITLYLGTGQQEATKLIVQ